VIALVAGIGVLAKIAIVILVIAGASGFTLATLEHGWIDWVSSKSIVRGILILLAIWSGMIVIGYKAWPLKELVKITPEIVWIPASLQEGQPLGPAQLNASATVDGKEVKGRAVYDPAIGATLLAGTQTLRVDFTFDDDPYNPVSKAVAVEVLPKPKPHNLPLPPARPTPPPNPITITSIHTSTQTPATGVQLAIRVNLQNVSGKTLSVKEAASSGLRPISTNEPDNIPLEEDMWSHLMAGIGGAPVAEISTAENGLFNVPLHGQALTQNEADALISGRAGPYFLLVFQDANTGENLVEVCGRIDGPDSFHSCSHHNKP